MRNAIILHGAPEKENYYDPNKPSESNAHWLPWLQKELMIRDIKADTPEVPYAYEPKWNIWCREVERYDIGPETTLVGHSAGAGFWLQYLSHYSDITVDRVFLVGPWLDPGNTLQTDFYDKLLDRELTARTNGITIFRSDDDSDSVQTSVGRIQEEVDGIFVKEFTGLGHFTYENLQGTSFPELRDAIIKA